MGVRNGPESVRSLRGAERGSVLGDSRWRRRAESACGTGSGVGEGHRSRAQIVGLRLEVPVSGTRDK